MPLIILTGYPCSGLSYRARQLSASLEAVQEEYLASIADDDDATAASKPKPRYKIHVVTSHDEAHPRTVYDNARSEKEARAVVYAKTKRALGRDSIVIVDGMNYIKGWRYQLWCEAKALSTTSCVVHVGTPANQCVANNQARLRRKQEQQGNEQPQDSQNEASNQTAEAAQAEPQLELDTEEPYPPELLDNLIFRYEEPSTYSRWDKPLFTVPWSDKEPPVHDIWTALTGTTIAKPDATQQAMLLADALSASGQSSAHNNNPSYAPSVVTKATTAGVSRNGLPRPKVKPHQATVLPTATDPTALYSLEKRISAIINAIRTFTLATPSAEAAVAQSPDGRGITIPVPEASSPVFIPAHVATGGTTDELAGAGGILALPRLQRLRRQWIGLNRAYIGQSHGAGGGGLTMDQVPDAFVRFLNAEFSGDDA
ncbi:RNA polymerase II Elongator complex associated protein Kti12, putative [Paecilomyces variotii No. 5]|uniref:RNA polymerase II Elongator complex associated protein Kti12, putative n=1 Tax=Byssochlamys spectabilis (strain No. 5 / NBRC 109023) TaxID=1356009 RepID=V5FDZ6_BYSSN|nr:RNA polymerase II Elongator complex associated protein Kti12, putative [Paecilomyces variotii No. 5]